MMQKWLIIQNHCNELSMWIKHDLKVVLSRNELAIPRKVYIVDILDIVHFSVFYFADYGCYVTAICQSVMLQEILDAIKMPESNPWRINPLTNYLNYTIIRLGTYNEYTI